MSDEPMLPYVFFRAEGFYVVELRHDQDALDCVPLNPGTLRVEDLRGRVVWEPTP